MLSQRRYWYVFIFWFSFFLAIPTLCLFALEEFFCDDEQSNLLQDLLIVSYVNQRIDDRLPVTYNHWLQGGYLTMPSARMGVEGEIGAGYSYVPPYRTYNLRCQLIERLEISGNYRIFKGVKDPVLGAHGFGDFSDKGANIKFSLFSAEDSHYRLPGIAIGADDIIGTRAFQAYYVVLTQVLLNYNMEISLGYGWHRIKGLFGGMAWFPFRCSCNDYLRGLSFTLEYDATSYQDPCIEKHPHGRVKNTPWNIGLKYRLWENVDLSFAYIRGDAFAFSISSYYNFGTTKGFLPKIEDPLPYRAPVNFQETGCLRPEDVLAQDFVYALRDQGFELMEAWLSYDECGNKILRLHVINGVYREELFVRNRLNALMAALTPEDICEVIVVLMANEVPIQEYRYRMEYVQAYRMQQIGRYELNTLTPRSEVSYPNLHQSKLIFKRDREMWTIDLQPKTHALFGSARGKFKYALGLALFFNGFLWNDIFYSVSFGYFATSNLYDICDVDRINPSQLINVRTDIINYYKQKSITVDEAYIQKIWNWGKGFYSRLTLGLFEVEYAGASGELLYYPVNSLWAVGVEGAILKKRTPEGIGFTNKVRKLEGFCPTYVKFRGSQYFLNLYYNWECASLLFKVSSGKFLANDYGTRFEVTRYFPSGLRLTFWYTYTNGHDIVNCQTYYDKGVYFSLPLDIFYTMSSRARWGYGMSAWLRDVGAKAYTGTEIYYLISEQRQ